MRKLFLMSAFVLASAAAAVPQAAQGQSAPAQPQAQPQTTQADTPKPVKKAHVRRHESDEAKARRIAARYGIYW